MNDKEKAQLYYKALNSILLKLQNHTVAEESSGRLKAFLVGYIMGVVGEVTTKESK